MSERGHSPSPRRVPGPPSPPLVPGHLGAPSERVCEAMFTVLSMARELGDAALISKAENRIRDRGVNPEALTGWAKRHEVAP